VVIVAKRADSAYESGKRSGLWSKYRLAIEYRPIRKRFQRIGNVLKLFIEHIGAWNTASLPRRS
jgi:hypothetical protein